MLVGVGVLVAAGVGVAVALGVGVRVGVGVAVFVGPGVGVAVVPAVGVGWLATTCRIVVALTAPALAVITWFPPVTPAGIIRAIWNEPFGRVTTVAGLDDGTSHVTVTSVCRGKFAPEMVTEVPIAAVVGLTVNVGAPAAVTGNPVPMSAVLAKAPSATAASWLRFKPQSSRDTTSDSLQT